MRPLRRGHRRAVLDADEKNPPRHCDRKLREFLVMAAPRRINPHDRLHATRKPRKLALIANSGKLVTV